MASITPELRDAITGILEKNRLMTLATVRPDGWPQATTVSFVHDGLELYCFVSRMGQKFLNMKRDARVSAAIGGEFSDPSKIKGLSLAARASVVEDRAEYDKMSTVFVTRFPEYAAWPRPNPAFAPLMRLTPEVISVLDYSKGFGHSDMVNVSRKDIPARVESRRQSWLANILGN